MSKDNLVMFDHEFDGVEHLVAKDQFGIDRDFIRPNNIMVISENNTYPVKDCKEVDVQLPEQKAVKLQIAENGEFTPDTYSGEYYDEVTVQMATELTDEEITITENGTYKPSTGKMFSKVTVDVPCDTMVGYDEWGDPVTPYVDPTTGKLKVNKLPDHIKVTVNPTKTTYLPNETIDYNGIEVRAYNKDGSLWTKMGYTNGIIPFNELIFPTSIIRGITITNEFTPSVQPNEDSVDYNKTKGEFDFRKVSGYCKEFENINITNKITLRDYNQYWNYYTYYTYYTSDAAFCCIEYYNLDTEIPRGTYFIFSALHPFTYFKKVYIARPGAESEHTYIYNVDVPQEENQPYMFIDGRYRSAEEYYGPCYLTFFTNRYEGVPIDYQYPSITAHDALTGKTFYVLAWLIACLGANDELNSIVLTDVPKYFALSSLDCGIAQPICYSTIGLIANGCADYINTVAYYLEGNDTRITLASAVNNKSFIFIAASNVENASLVVRKVTTDIRTGEENIEESYIKLGTSYTYDDKKVYFTSGTITTGGDINYIEPLATNDKVGLFYTHRGHIAWTIVYGEAQEGQESEYITETVNVEWKRPSDRKILETNLELHVLV